MKREQKKISIRRPVRKSVASSRKANQLSLDFTAGIPIEIHIPKFEIPNFSINLMPERKQEIQLIINESVSYTQRGITNFNPKSLIPIETF